MPWKNGRGRTAEIAVFPDDATLKGARFVWRASIAAIEDACEFSRFPGYDRMITVVSGAGMRLYVEPHGSHAVRYGDAALTFPGELHAHCHLLGGALEDFNLIVDRTRATGGLEVIKGARIPGSRPITSDFVLVHCVAGELEVSLSGERHRLPPRDTAIVDAHDATGLTLRITSAGEVSSLMLYAEISFNKGAEDA